MSHINPEHVITLQGQQYGTYRGVLDLAHSLGLEGIRTRIIQVPGPDNDHVAIVEAEVRLKDGRVFVDIADASPKNVHSRMSVALIRMASTRAKGRALRDAVNIGEALAEELPDLEPDQALAPVGSPRARDAAPSHRPIAPASPVAREEEADTSAPLRAVPSRATAALPDGNGEPRPAPATAPRETPEPAAAAAAAARGPAEPRPAEMVCSSPDCGRTVTQGQYNFSVTTYGAPLCPACQRKRRASQEKAS